MKLLILGGSGMLGHKLWQISGRRFDTHVTLRQSAPAYDRYRLFDSARTHSEVSTEEFATVERAFKDVRPDVVVNCIGIVKQDPAARNPITCISVNSLFPHKLAELCSTTGARLIQISTDCVFSGQTGCYSEEDQPDATDLYGRTKLLGELAQPNCLTLRTSIIGRELHGSHGLLEWFLAQNGTAVRGFKRAVFSGFTTNAFAEVLTDVISEHPGLTGIRHVAAEPINKFELLTLIRKIYGLEIKIEPDESFVCDRSLNGSRFRNDTGIVAPSWPDMIAAMHADKTPYDELRRRDAGR